MTTIERVCVLGVVAVVGVTTMAGPARADGCEAETAAVQALGKPDASLAPPTDPEAKRHLSEGNERHREGNKRQRVQEYDLAAAAYGQAVEAYKAGALIDGAPIFLYNLGQAYRLGGQYDKAIRQYQIFLDRGTPGPALRALIECHVQAMTRELDQAAAKEQPTGPAPDGAEEPGREARPRDELARPRPSPVARAHWYADGVGWGLAGGGAVAGAVGVVLLLDAGSLEDEAAREDREEVRDELRAQADGRRTWGAVVGAIGAAGLVAGVIKLALTPDEADAQGVTLLVGPRSLGLAWTF